LEKTIGLAKSDSLPYVDTIVAFRLLDKLNSNQVTDGTEAGQSNYGMIEDFNNAASGAATLKTYGKKFYDIVKPQVAGNYSALTSVLDKYYQIYHGTYPMDRTEDFESSVVKGNTLVTNHSDIKVSYSVSANADDSMLPKLSIIEKDDRQSLAFDFSADKNESADALGYIRFDLGKLKGGTLYQLRFDIDTESLDGVGSFSDLVYGMTTSEQDFNWASNEYSLPANIPDDERETDSDGNLLMGVVRYSWGTQLTKHSKGVDFYVGADVDNAAIIFQTKGTGNFRISFDNITLTEYVE